MIEGETPAYKKLEAINAENVADYLLLAQAIAPDEERADRDEWSAETLAALAVEHRAAVRRLEQDLGEYAALLARTAGETAEHHARAIFKMVEDREAEIRRLEQEKERAEQELARAIEFHKAVVNEMADEEGKLSQILIDMRQQLAQVTQERDDWKQTAQRENEGFAALHTRLQRLIQTIRSRAVTAKELRALNAPGSPIFHAMDAQLLAFQGDADDLEKVAACLEPPQ